MSRDTRYVGEIDLSPDATADDVHRLLRMFNGTRAGAFELEYRNDPADDEPDFYVVDRQEAPADE